MRVTIEKLRMWLLVAAGLLVGVILLFLGYARYQMHRAVRDLPQKLGVEIQQSTNGFTFSKSDKGKTLFTLHASRAVQLKNGGKARLHDVSIVLYGRDSERADRIYGSEFDYDPASGVARADGPVDIDLQSPGAAASGTEQAPPDASRPALDDKSVVHARTSGLVFAQKTGVASTDQDFEFQFAGVNGNAHGAQYLSNEGLLVLQSNVNVRMLLRGRPVVLTAAHAELHRDSEQAILRVVMFHSLGITGRADQVVIHMRKDGSAEHVEATGNVTVANLNGSQMIAPRAEVALDATSQPQTLDLLGGIRYVDSEPFRHVDGQATEAHLQFGSNTTVRHVQLLHAVQMHEQDQGSGSDAKAVTTQRQLHADRVEVELKVDRKGRSVPKLVRAFGGAGSPAQMLINTWSMSDSGVGGKPGTPLTLRRQQSQKTVLRGDELDAHLVQAGGRLSVSHVQGSGHTSMVQTAPNGSVQTSTGDRLDVVLAPPAEGKPADNRHSAPGHADANAAQVVSAVQIISAVQDGHVVIRQTAPPAKSQGSHDKSGTPETTSATADRAEYRGDTQMLVLTGDPQVVDAGMTLWATTVRMSRETGDAVAEGNVRGSYLQPASTQQNNSEPIHIVAEHALLRRAEQEALFYGSHARDARLWQGASQVEAPVLDFQHAQQTLTARADTASRTLPVHAVFLSMARRKTGGPVGVVHIRSRQMVYSDVARRADFTGVVQVQSADGRMQANHAQVFLQTASNAGGNASKITGKLFGGSVQRIVAQGDVELQQPGRRGTGQQLVYTAGDGNFVLTGTAAAPPRLVDNVKGTVSGEVLIFNSLDDSVIVSNKGPRQGDTASGRRTRTETRVQSQKQH
jgi:lipopolysaccharide export system protein LptA